MSKLLSEPGLEIRYPDSLPQHFRITVFLVVSNVLHLLQVYFLSLGLIKLHFHNCVLKLSPLKPCLIPYLLRKNLQVCHIPVQGVIYKEMELY